MWKWLESPGIGGHHAHLLGLGSIALCLSKAKLQREAECIGVRPGDEACAILLERMEVGQKKREAIC